MLTTDPIKTPKVRDSFLGLSFFVKSDTIFPVEFKGPPHGGASVVSTRIEGFDTPWLHTKNHPNGRFLVCKNVFLPILYK